MLVVKKPNQTKSIFLIVIGILMFAGMAFFIYKNYELNNIEYSDLSTVRLDPVSFNKNGSGDPADIEPALAGKESTGTSTQSEYDFINKRKWRSLIQTNYFLPSKIATGTDNPYKIETIKPPSDPEK